jgi:hypothetical protein
LVVDSAALWVKAGKAVVGSVKYDPNLSGGSQGYDGRLGEGGRYPTGFEEVKFCVKYGG